MKTQKLTVSLLTLVVFILLAFSLVTPPSLPQGSFDYDTLVERRGMKKIL